MYFRLLCLISLFTGQLYSDHIIGSYGAIAYSFSTGRAGWSHNQPTLFQAQRTAEQYCGAFDCRTVVQVQNACGAFAVGAYNGYGWSITTDSFSAQNAALRNCHYHTYGCSIRAWVCSS